MNRKLAASALAALLYAQGLIGVAAFGSVLLGGHSAEMAHAVNMAAGATTVWR